MALFTGIGLYLHHQDRRPQQLVSLQQQAKTNAQDYVNSQLKPAGFIGTIVIIRQGHEYVDISRGLANFASKRSNSASTTYEIDSVQKSITATMVMKAVQAGQLHLNDHLNRYYPQVPGSEHITIRQMLDMTSGLSLKKTNPKKIGSTLPKDPTDAQVIAAYIKQVHYDAGARNNWNYQPVNYNLLSGILEKITGKPYAQLLQQEVITPLKLRHTHLAYKPQPSDATGYGRKKGAANYKGPYHTTVATQRAELGTGQLFMSTTDLYRTEAAIVTGSLLGSKKSALTLHRPGSASAYGGGLYNSTHYMFANGFGYGFTTLVRISRNGKSAVILLGNTDDIHYRLKKLADQLTARYVR